ncbi:methyltransferase domain-containing protein [Elizabethkingia argentiflava]|uniref:Methyltransferase domain-containing protein n=1 Tax=Elizabethkingia argenteiflava TaxID=2681556 RepID=A0A845PPL6_9FLAO|nr:class I SAM-dependent methyltransferase [Elizabethkingia argenteiflava]NAW50269.1 methyltransferase domain-containing protein [Elizabethkingia argenteiflava]
MKSRILIQKGIDDFYSKTSEETRLQIGLGPLEFERNKNLISRFISQKPSIVLDVGGGPGIYSEWMAKNGHTVYLVEPVLKHIKQAQKRAKKAKFECIQGEAGNLKFENNFADIVILHGPLYHLQDEKKRNDCLKEARRVLKPGGILLGFAINYTASTIVALIQGVIGHSEFFSMCREELTSGIHDAPKNMPGILSHGYYYKQEDLIKEVEECSFEFLDIFAVEGFIWLDKNYFESQSNPSKQKILMELLKITENDKNLISFSPHMMIAAKK